MFSCMMLTLSFPFRKQCPPRCDIFHSSGERLEVGPASRGQGNESWTEPLQYAGYCRRYTHIHTTSISMSVDGISIYIYQGLSLCWCENRLSILECMELGHCHLILVLDPVVKSFGCLNHSSWVTYFCFASTFSSTATWPWDSDWSVFNSINQLPIFTRNHLQHHPHFTVWWMLLMTNILCSFFLGPLIRPCLAFHLKKEKEKVI